MHGVLGFQRKRRAKGNVVLWNDTTIKRLKQQYGIIDEESVEVQEKRRSGDASIFAVDT